MIKTKGLFCKIVPLYLFIYYREDSIIISGFALVALSRSVNCQLLVADKKNVVHLKDMPHLGYSISNSHSVAENFRQVLVLCNSVTSRF